MGRDAEAMGPANDVAGLMIYSGVCLFHPISIFLFSFLIFVITSADAAS